jgi:proteic killer suppression protein
MIETFKSKGLKEVHETGKSRRVRQDQVARINLLLDALNRANRPEDMNAPGFGFHLLRGKPQRYAIGVNGPWRITFGWHETNAVAVDLEQYH